MRTTIATYPAKNGDCFLISYQDGKKQKHILIDSGYKDTFQNYLKKDLAAIGNKGEIIEKFILTHIDADHIQGAIALLEDNYIEKFIDIKEIWHNTFRHLVKTGELGSDESQEKKLRRLIERGYAVNKSNIKGDTEISARQGTTVGALILQGGYSWNSDFKGNAVSTEFLQEIIVDELASLFMLSPNKQKLDNLILFWKEELQKYGINYDVANSSLYDDAFEMALSWEKKMYQKKPVEISAADQTVEELLRSPFYEDKAVNNGSSIAFILKIKDKKLLFLADAHADIIMKSLADYKKHGTIMFDLIKVSHHGSFNNISKELLEKADAVRYLISTNGGKHDHPDRETIAHIISRPTNINREIYFNYPTKNSKYFDRTDWKEKFNYSVHYLNQEPYILTL